MIAAGFNWGLVIDQFFQQALGPEAIAFALAAIGLNIHFGYAGMLNFGVAGFMAAGGYGVGMTVFYWNQNMWWGILVGIVFSGMMGLILGIPTLRLRADYLAIVTIAASEMLRIFLRSASMRDITGGSEGISGFASPFYVADHIFKPQQRYGFGPLSFFGNQAWAVIVGWTVVAVVVFFVWLVMKSPWGRVVKAIREDEDAARALGKNAYSYKVQALVLGGVICGIGGMFQVLAKQTVQPDAFQPPFTFFVWTVLILGGVGKIMSPIAGSMIFWALISLTQNVLNELINNDLLWVSSFMETTQVGQVRFMLIGLGLMLLMVFRPQGIFGSKAEMALDDR